MSKKYMRREIMQMTSAAFMSCLGTTASAQRIRLFIKGSVRPTIQKWGQWISQETNKVTGNSVETSASNNIADTFQSMDTGENDMAYIDGQEFSYDPSAKNFTRFSYLKVPFLFTDFPHWKNVSVSDYPNSLLNKPSSRVVSLSYLGADHLISTSPINSLTDIQGKKIIIGGQYGELARAFTEVARAEVTTIFWNDPGEFLAKVIEAQSKGAQIVQVDLFLADQLGLLERFPVINLAGMTVSPAVALVSNSVSQKIGQQKAADIDTIMKKACVQQTDESLNLELALFEKLRIKHEINEKFPRPAFRSAFLEYFSKKDPQVGSIVQELNAYQKA